MSYFSLAISFFFRLPSNAFPDIGSVGRIEKKNHKKCRNRRPGTPASLLWSLETTGHEPKSIWRKSRWMSFHKLAMRMTSKVNFYILDEKNAQAVHVKKFPFLFLLFLCCYYAHFSNLKNGMALICLKNSEGL